MPEIRRMSTTWALIESQDHTALGQIAILLGPTKPHNLQNANRIPRIAFPRSHIPSHHLASKTILRTPPSRRTDAERKSHATIIKRIPPRIRLTKQMPTTHRLPISLRVPRTRHRRRRRKRPARRPPRLRHPDRFGLRNRIDAPREIAQTGRRAARIIRVDVRADPVDLVNDGLPVAIRPDVRRVDVAEGPFDASGAHGAARLADVVDDVCRGGAFPIEVFAADRDAHDEGTQFRILLHGRLQRVEFVGDCRLAA